MALCLNENSQAVILPSCPSPQPEPLDLGQTKKLDQLGKPCPGTGHLLASWDQLRQVGC